MKFITICAILLFFTDKLFAQQSERDFWKEERDSRSDSLKTDIDPRQYVKVLYKKNPNYGPRAKMEVQRTIWNWDDAGYSQKFKIIDNEGFLDIYFKKAELADNYNFQGNISLEAYLKGKDGERKIEVGPYSLIGVDRKEIGIESFPATTAAQLLFNTIIEMRRLIVSVNFLPYDTLYSFYSDLQTLRTTIVNINDARKGHLSDRIVRTDPALFTIQEISRNDSFYFALQKYLTNPESFSYTAFTEQLSVEAKRLSDFLRVRTLLFKKDLKFLEGKLALINEYLESFEKAGSDAVKAFLELASKDRINFNHLRQNLIQEQKTLHDLLGSVELSKDPTVLLESPDVLDLAIDIISNLNSLSSIEGSKMEVLIKSKYVMKGEVMARSAEIKRELEDEYGPIPEKHTDLKTNYPNGDGEASPYYKYIFLRLLEKSKNFERFKQSLSVMAAEIIYRKLVYASIDLGKSGAQPGDVLYLNVVWKNIDGGKDSTGTKSSLLPIGKYYLRETGWKTEIAESFYLVERINEPPPDAQNLSKSNFKGAYGASIMRTFHFNENYQRTAMGRFVNWLQPSFGFNITYLDFYTNKDIEIGSGLQLGLFKNVLYFGSGINLHSIRGPEKHSAMFFMFGVSFTNIAAKFKSSANGD